MSSLWNQSIHMLLRTDADANREKETTDNRENGCSNQVPLIIAHSTPPPCSEVLHQQPPTAPSSPPPPPPAPSSPLSQFSPTGDLSPLSDDAFVSPQVRESSPSLNSPIFNNPTLSPPQNNLSPQQISPAHHTSSSSSLPSPS